MANLKGLYSEYKAAHDAAEAVDIMDEAKFDEMLDIESDKLDALVDAILRMADGKIGEFDLRCLITSDKHAAEFESLISRLDG